jgi:Zn-dependent metalloprotease
MQITEIKEMPDNTVQVRLQHVLYKTPVWGDELVIQMNDQGVINRVEGKLSPHLEEKTFNRPMYAAISKKKAIAIALASSQAGRMQDEDPQVDMYYHPSIAGTPLIYEVSLKNDEFKHRYQKILIHSLSGRVIEQRKS